MVEWILNKDNINYLIVIATIIGPIVASIIAFIFQLIMKKSEKERWIEDRLFSIQKIAFEYPYVEDEVFISKWNDFVENYRQNKLDDEQKKELDKYLRYEQYCEMIFNLLEISHRIYKTEEKILNKIDFKNWVRTHKNWWFNPIEKYSNKDIYNKKLVEMIEKWTR